MTTNLTSSQEGVSTKRTKQTFFRWIARQCMCKCHGRVPPTPEPRLRPPRYKALIIGIGYNKTPAEKGLRLGGCIGDARAVEDMLVRVQNFRPSDITVMTDEEADGIPDSTKRLEPTLDNIIYQMGKLVADAGPGDVFVFYYAGHSNQTPALVDKFEVDGMDEYLYSSDCEMILDDEIRKVLVNPLVDTGARLTAIVDACHSGTILDLRHYRSPRPPPFHQGSYSNLDYIRKLASNLPWVRAEPRPRAVSLPSKLGPAAKCKRLSKKALAKVWWCLAKVVIDFQHHRTWSNDKEQYMPPEALADDKSSGDPMSPAPFSKDSAWASRSECCRAHPTTGGTLVISVSACRDHQVAIEDSELKQGLFTKALLGLVEADPKIRVGALEEKLNAELSEAEQFHCSVRSCLPAKQKGGSKKKGKMTKKKEEKRRGFLKRIVDRGIVQQQPEIGSMNPICAEDQLFVRREELEV
ncbi:caspase domain-containing protein [Amylostereum chailletii]|nr:caspase domain-containing protein [Amylostereum chailletii]